jgi:hypothetical protein
MCGVTSSFCEVSEVRSKQKDAILSHIVVTIFCFFANKVTVFSEVSTGKKVLNCSQKFVQPRKNVGKLQKVSPLVKQKHSFQNNYNITFRNNQSNNRCPKTICRKNGKNYQRSQCYYQCVTKIFRFVNEGRNRCRTT